MSPQCDNCGGHVSGNYHRVRSDNEGTLHACPGCTDARQNQREAAGLEPINAKTTKAGYTAPVGRK